MSILTIKHLSIHSASKRIVEDLTFRVEKGEWLAVVGQSGSGKSMTASAIGRLLPPNVKAEGEVVYNGQNLLSLSGSAMRKLRGTSISFVFQDYGSSFNPFLTIGRHFDEYQKTHERKSKKERGQEAKKALASVGLPEAFYARYPSQLSGGQLQRVAIALALLFKPDLVIADEPTTALDSVTAASVLELLAELKEKTGCTVLFITHDLRHVRKYADRVMVMYEGTIVEEGDKEEIMQNPSHPYTKRLIAAIPSLQKPRLTLVQEHQKDVAAT